MELSDMRLFVQAVTHGSLSAAGRVLGFSPAVGSKRLARLEARLGARLVQRTSRRLNLTEEGAAFYERCQAILAAVEEAEGLVAAGRQTPRGTLQVTAPVALGRRWLGPALVEFARLYPELRIRFSLSDAVVDLVEAGFDCAVRIGGSEDSRLVARPLAANYRVLCAAPAYIERCGEPRTPDDLRGHRAIYLGSAAAPFTRWRLQPTAGAITEAVQVAVPVHMATDNGEQAHDWALAGLGLVRRSIWDVAEDLAAGRLVRVLPEWRSDQAPLQLVYPSRRYLPARTQLLVEHLTAHFAAAAAKIPL